MASSPTDQELLSAAARGDQAAFSQLYQRYRNRVYGFTYRMLGRQEAAEDITHEVFLVSAPPAQAPESVRVVYVKTAGGCPRPNSEPSVTLAQKGSAKAAGARAAIPQFETQTAASEAGIDYTTRATPEQVEKWGIDPARVENGFLSKYTQPILLDDGDIISVDVLVEPRTGAKLIDYFQIFTGEPITRRNPDKLKAEARALTVEDLILTVEGYEVRRNGEKLKSHGGGASGRYIWLAIPHVGRAIFTLATPPEGSGFEQTAIVNDQQLVFWVDGAQYEWISKSRIVPADGSFHVWMKFDSPFSLPPKAREQIKSGESWSHGASDNLPALKKED